MTKRRTAKQEEETAVEAASEQASAAKPRAKKAKNAAASEMASLFESPAAAPEREVEISEPAAAKKSVKKAALKKKAAPEFAEPAPETAPSTEQAAEEQVIPSAAAEAAEPAPKKPRARRTKGRDLVADIPAEAEVAEVLHEPQHDSRGEQPDAESDAESEAELAEIIAQSKAEVDDEAGDDPAEETAAAATKYPEPPAHLERLQKILAKAGVASRRAAEEMILAGRVQVNGKIVTELGTKADLGRDHIRVDSKLLHGPERLRYFVLNKPKGYVTTVSDPEKRPTVMHFFAGERERLYPVGRLDYLSEGLLLVTNDGELANKLTKAASGVEKTYLVKVAGEPSEELLDQLREGVVIERGRHGTGSGRVRTAPAQVRKVREGDNPWYEVILIEGRNRELRKMFEEIGHHVEKIRRVGYGPLVLDLEPGKLRELEPEEVHKLRLTAEGKLKPRRRRGPAEARLSREAGKPVRYGKDDRGKRPVRRGEYGEAPPRNPGSRPEPRAQSRPEIGPGQPKRATPAPRDPATGMATGKRMHVAAAPRDAGDRSPTAPRRDTPRKDTPRKEWTRDSAPPRRSPSGTPDRKDFSPRSPQKPFKKPFRKPFEKPLDKPSRPFSERPSRPENLQARPTGRRSEDFGEGPIQRTPGFRVEPVADQPREPKPRSGGFSRPPVGGKPFRPSPRPDASPDRPFRKPQGQTDRPAGGPARSFSAPRPYRDRDGESSPGRSAGRGSERGSSNSGEFRRGGPSRPPAAGGRPSRFTPRAGGPSSRPSRPFTEGEGRPRPARPTGSRPSGSRPGEFRPADSRPRTGSGPRPPADRPRPFAGAKPEGSRKRDEGDAPRVKERWRNSFTGKNKGRPKPKPKKDE